MILQKRQRPGLCLFLYQIAVESPGPVLDRGEGMSYNKGTF